MNRQLAVVAACLALSGCAAAGGAPKTSETPRRDLAGRPSTPPGAAPATTSGFASPTGSGVGSPGASTPSSSTSTPGADHGTSASTGSSSESFHEFVALTDPSGDAGVGAPAYVDLRAVTLADNGASLSVTVAVDGSLPGTAEPADTIGIGVDLYRPGTGRESEY